MHSPVPAPVPAPLSLSQKQRIDTRTNHYHKIIPLRARHPLLRLDTLPFIIVYTLLIIIDNLSVHDHNDYNDANDENHGSVITVRTIQKWNTLVIFPLVLLSHLSLFLWTRWSVSVETFVGYKQFKLSADSLKMKMKMRGGNDFQFHSWTHCLVIPPSPVVHSSSSIISSANSNNKSNTTTTSNSKNNSRYKQSQRGQNTKKRNAVLAASVGRREIVPIHIKGVGLRDFNSNTNSNSGKGKGNDENSNKSKLNNAICWVASISYEETIFRCCISQLSQNSQNNANVNASASTSASANTNEEYEYIFDVGKDVEMDSIWGIVDENGDTAINTNNTCTEDENNEAPKAISIERDLTSSKTVTTENKLTSSPSPSSSLSSSSIFHRLHYPIDLPLTFYTEQWRGHTTKQSIQQTYNVYSNNNLKINLPPFIDILTQQLLAPFFLFQLFCVLLWCLDEYWYYAIFTLFTLILFECTVAHTRLRNLLRLRETLRLPFGVWVYRCSKWKQISTEDLIAGDVISLSSSQEQHRNLHSHSQMDHHENGTHIPADLLLLKGGAVVNEAMLTGESVPQMKEAIDVVASAITTTSSNKTTSLLSVKEKEELNKFDIEDSSYKRAILFGGTLLVNHSSKSMNEDGESENAQKDTKVTPSSQTREITSPPDDGCVAMVLRTGFDTQQGSLLRTMVHTSTKAQSDGVNTRDTFLFIVILLLCAVFSSIIVLNHGWDDPTRNRFKLILHVVIIITSVVPPELPMELSLAVTSSLSDLIKRCAVYCTEPFRIPLAGMVDTCCFDKTGTLTSDEMVLRGVRLPFTENDGKISISDSLVSPTKESADENGDADDDGKYREAIPPEIIRVMVGCQSLASITGYDTTSTRGSGNLIGDPLEKAVIGGCGWSLLSNTLVAPPQSTLSSPNSPGMINIQHRFAFTSKLKRMTVIATDLGCKKTWALAKGAPETLKELFDVSTIPESYDLVSRHHMSLGQRVLAMGYKELSSKVTVSSWKKRGREAVESDLTFAGFLILDCPLKTDSRKVIKELRSSGHDVVMITGDAVLTAAEVARQVGIISRSKKIDTYELREVTKQESHGNNVSLTKFAFVPIGARSDKDFTEKQIAYSLSNLNVIKEMLSASEIAGICVTGDVLTNLAMEAVRVRSSSENKGEDSYIDMKTILLHPDAQTTLQRLVPLISVFARHAPRQKEAVIAAFNGAGRYTLMCGDGTNDVGALKMSHVGISIISVPDVEAKQREALDGLAKIRTEEENGNKKEKKGKKKKKKNRKKNWEEHVKALAEAEEELNSVSLGDASVASPFTSRVTSIRCTKDVLQRGRCTLVTMLQIYKVLGVNCLVNALVLSSLHLVGAKQGDAQLTAVGLVVASLFFFITKGQPLDKLSKRRPPSSILSVEALVSIVVQFGIHFLCIMAVTHMSCIFLDPKYDPSLVPDGAFNPNTLNTATFLITVQATVTTFVVNYRGRPFMQDLHENKIMMRSLQLCYGLLFICALELFPPINDLLQLAPLPSASSVDLLVSNGIERNSSPIILHVLNPLLTTIGFKASLCLFMALDSLVAYVAERALLKIFEG